MLEGARKILPTGRCGAARRGMEKVEKEAQGNHVENTLHAQQFFSVRKLKKYEAGKMFSTKDHPSRL